MSTSKTKSNSALNAQLPISTQMAKDNGIATLANMIIVGSLLRHNPELSFDGAKEAVNKLVPPKKAALIELNKKALTLGKEYGV